MNKLVGVKWGDLKEETKEFLLENSNCVDAVNCNEAQEGECIVDLNDTLSVAGKIIDDQIEINDEAIIYNPSEGVILEARELILEINEVMTASEAAEVWGRSEGTIRAAIKAKKFIIGVDYRKAGGTTLITREAMERVYGDKRKKSLNL